jgi:Fe(3+) dicitrate transport protein
LRPGGFTDEITVVGSHVAGSEETLRRIPGSVEVLERSGLETARAFTTSETLRKVSGVNVRDEEGLGLRPNVGIRGLNPTRSSKVLLLEDGVPLTYAPYGDNATYYHPPIERFERVEVLKGSGQIAYGPSTIGGVINYITPEPPARPSGALSITGGSRDYLNAHAAWGTTWNRTGVLVDGMRKQGQGARDNVDSRLTDVTVKAQHAFGDGQQLVAKVDLFRERSQVTYSGLRQAEWDEDPRQNPFANDEFSGDRLGASAIYRVVLSDWGYLTTTAYAAGFSRDWWRQSSNSAQRPNDARDPKCGGMANLDTTCGNEGRLRDYLMGGVESRARTMSGWLGWEQETDFGARIHAERQERLQVNGDTPTARTGMTVEDNRREADAYSGFVQQRWMRGAWALTPGVRLERVEYARTNRLAPGGEASGHTGLTQLVPGVGVAYAPGSDTTVFAGVHRGFAPPRVEDVISNSGGTVDLDPELSWNYEAGVRLGAARGVRLEATAFRMDYENQIVPASLAGGVGAALTNGGQTRHTGIEASGALDFGTMWRGPHNPFVRAAVTWLPEAVFVGPRFSAVPGFLTVPVTGNRLPYAPEFLATLTLGYAGASGLDLRVEAQHASEQFADDLNTVAGTPDGQRGLIPAYTYWHASAAVRVAPLRATAFVAVKNLLDATFIVDRSRGLLPSHPRLVHVGLTWRY